MNVEGTKVDSDINGLSYGAGVKYKINENVYAFIDYALIYDNATTLNDLKVNSDIRTLSLGLIYKF